MGNPVTQLFESSVEFFPQADFVACFAFVCLFWAIFCFCLFIFLFDVGTVVFES